eukprot:1151666-Pelagomonas_calceolata.AAC.1
MNVLVLRRDLNKIKENYVGILVLLRWADQLGIERTTIASGRLWCRTEERVLLGKSQSTGIALKPLADTVIGLLGARGITRAELVPFVHVGPHAHWVKGLFRNLGEAGCTTRGYVSVPLLECYKHACLFCSIHSVCKCMSIGMEGATNLKVYHISSEALCARDCAVLLSGSRTMFKEVENSIPQEMVQKSHTRYVHDAPCVSC